MVKRRKRDIYGNWVWEDDVEIRIPDEKNPSNKSTKPESPRIRKEELKDEEDLHLDWKDFVALSIASLETFLLPIVVFILVLLGIVIGLSFIK